MVEVQGCLKYCFVFLLAGCSRVQLGLLLQPSEVALSTTCGPTPRNFRRPHSSVSTWHRPRRRRSLCAGLECRLPLLFLLVLAPVHQQLLSLLLLFHCSALFPTARFVLPDCAPTQPEETTGKLRPHASLGQRMETRARCRAPFVGSGQREEEGPPLD